MQDKTANLEQGLSQEEVAKRLERDGYNEIDEKEESSLHRLFRRFWGPIPWMIEVAAILSASVGRWEDFSIIIVLLLINAFVDFYQESKALDAIKVLQQKLAHEALVLRDGSWKKVLARELVRGDIIKIKLGDVVPADIRLLDGSDFIQVDQSALTGESLPVNAKTGEGVYANAIIKQGEMRAEVRKTGAHTYFGKTVGLVAKAQLEEKSHFQKMVINVGNFLITLTMVMIMIIVTVGIIRDEPVAELLIFSLVLTISAIPIALPAVLTVTMAVGAKVLSAKGAIVSRLAAIEELAGMDILCSDKTGTLTQNTMSLSKPYVSQGYSAKRLFAYAALASKKENEDPIEKPIFDYLQEHKEKLDLPKMRLEAFIPFDPVKKRTEALYSSDKERLLITKGAPQVIIALSDLSKEDKTKAQQKVNEFATKGFRTLGVAYKVDDDEKFRFIGLIPLFDPPREDSLEAIRASQQKGITFKMITGDNLAVARYIASVLEMGDNILDVRELHGENTKEYTLLTELISRSMIEEMFPELEREAQQEKVRAIVAHVKDALQHVPLPKGSVKKHESEIIALIEQADGFAQVFPEDKYLIVDSLQKENHIVGMTGDGVNDAPALKKADCGIAVSGATDAARAAADIVLTSPGLMVIVDAIKQARITFERMKSYTIFRIAETIRIIVFMTLAIVVFNFYPLTALMIIVLALLNDIPILAIAYDNTKVRPAPVRWDMKEMLILSTWLGLAGVISSFLLFWIMMSLLHLPEVLIQSLFFAKLVIAGHGTIYNTRTDEWFFKKPYPSWTLFLATFSSRVLGTIIAIYGFGLMEPIGWEWAGLMWGYALIWFVFNDIVKRSVLRYYRNQKSLQ